MKSSDPQLKESVSLLILELQFIVSIWNSSSRLVLGFGVIALFDIIIIILIAMHFPNYAASYAPLCWHYSLCFSLPIMPKFMPT